MQGFEPRRDLIKHKFGKASLASVLRIDSQGAKGETWETTLEAVAVT